MLDALELIGVAVSIIYTLLLIAEKVKDACCNRRPR